MGMLVHVYPIKRKNYGTLYVGKHKDKSKGQLLALFIYAKHKYAQKFLVLQYLMSNMIIFQFLRLRRSKYKFFTVVPLSPYLYTQNILYKSVKSVQWLQLPIKFKFSLFKQFFS